MLTSYSALTMVCKFFLICVTTVISLVKTILCICPGVQSEFKTTQFHAQKMNDAEEQVTEKYRKRCCPYDFDGTVCRNVGNRILCGYNRNIGSPNVNDEELTLNNGCRIKNGRLECGYDQPPYTNFRRPPGWDNIEEPQSSKESHETATVKFLKLYSKLSTAAPKVTTQCLEIRERIVCKTI